MGSARKISKTGAPACARLGRKKLPSGERRVALSTRVKPSTLEFIAALQEDCNVGRNLDTLVERISTGDLTLKP
jgi:hypothetical protein